MNDDHQAKTDEELATLSLGDKDSFALLIDRYEPKLRRYAGRLGVGRLGEIDDLLQNTFLKAYENLADFDTRLKFSSWIYRIAHNEAISLFRRLRARPEGHLKSMTDEELSGIASDFDLVRDAEGQRSRESLRGCLDILDEKYREVLVLKYFEDKSYDEISDILKISPGTVATRLNRAKEKVKKEMEKINYVYE
jgi:RNA polymerase sigma-70 factor (ECF subfamily)